MPETWIYNVVCRTKYLVPPRNRGEGRVSPIPRGWSVTFGFAIAPLVLLSTAAYLLDFPRLFAYGLLLAAAPLIGEWLFRGGYVRHHGIPVCLGAVAMVMAVTGLIHFLAVARRKPPGAEDPSLEAQGV